MTHKEMEHYIEKVAELTLSIDKKVDALIKASILSAVRCRILERRYSPYVGTPPVDVVVDAAKGSALEIALFHKAGYDPDALMEVANSFAQLLLTYNPE